MNSKFSFALGFSLILVSIASIFLDVNEYTIIGINISAVIFSIINILSIIIKFKYKKIDIDFLYIIPFIVFFLFSCFSDSLNNVCFINKLTDKNLLNFISIVSFGLIFISSYYTYKSERAIYLDNINKIWKSDLDHNDKIIKILSNKNNDTESHLLQQIIGVYDKTLDRIFLETNLTKLKKDYYTIEEVDEAYKESQIQIEKIRENKK